MTVRMLAGSPASRLGRYSLSARAIDVCAKPLPPYLPNARRTEGWVQWLCRYYGRARQHAGGTEYTGSSV